MNNQETLNKLFKVGIINIVINLLTITTLIFFSANLNSQDFNNNSNGQENNNQLNPSFLSATEIYK